MKILGICGSARGKSFNRMAMNVMATYLPKEVEWQVADLSPLPIYNQDIQDAGFPPAVQALADDVRAAAAVVFATPEHNWSIPALLKNAIDWVARVPNQPFAGKTVGIMGATIGMFGTARAQLHLRDIMVPLDGRPINRPPIMIPQAQNKFAADGTLNDEPTRALLQQFAEAVTAAAKKAQG